MRQILRVSGRLMATAMLLAFVTSAGAQAKMPAWFDNPPQDTPDAWYAIGEGGNLEEARRFALRNVAAKLRSAIEGTIESTVSDRNGQINREAMIRVSEQVTRAEFSQAEVVANARSPVGVAALVKVGRQGFIADTRTQLSVLEQPIGDAERVLVGASILEQFLALRGITQQLEQATALSWLLSAAGASEGRAGVLRYGALNQRGRRLAASLVFHLKARAEDADIASAVGGFLANHEMRNSTQRTPGANVISISSQASHQEVYGSKLTKLRVRLSIVDDSGRAVASREYDVSGMSGSDYDGARAAAVRQFGQDLAEAGPVAGLGLLRRE